MSLWPRSPSAPGVGGPESLCDWDVAQGARPGTTQSGPQAVSFPSTSCGMDLVPAVSRDTPLRQRGHRDLHAHMCLVFSVFAHGSVHVGYVCVYLQLVV